MNNIRLFPGAQQLPPAGVNEEFVTVLEMLLEKARAGKLQNLVGVGVDADGGVYRVQYLPEGSNYYKLLGMLEWLKLDFVMRHQS